MNITAINNDNTFINPIQKTQVEKRYGGESVQETEKPVTQRTDKLELSAEAMKLQPIKNRVDEGFYNRPEVIREVALRIYQDMENKA